MRATGKPYTIAMAMILSWGLLYSQVCEILCASPACSVQSNVMPPLQNKPARKTESGHCPQHKSSSRETQPEPQRPGNSHDCNTHGVVSMLPPPAVMGLGGLHPSSQPDVIAAFVFAGFALDHQAGNPAERTVFKSPPRRPLRSILRI
ncbi:MAG: hypothetical protein ACREEM_35430 [Blastocatellia bacterium]